MTNHKRSERGITLVEMIVVVAIAVMMMRLLLPAFKGLGGSKQSFAATTQFIGDLSTARLMAMNNGSPVYVVFMPLANDIGGNGANLKSYFERSDGGNPRLGGQLVSYAFYAEYVLGDSLGSSSRRWLSDWKQLPEGAFFPREMLNDLRWFSVPHLGNNDTVDTVDPDFELILPYIGFDARGSLIGVNKLPNDQGAIIRLVEGGVLPPEKNPSTGEYLWDDATRFNADEPLNIGRAENYVLINFQTGRARTTVIKAVPAGNKLVKICIIRFTDRLWKSSPDYYPDDGLNGPKGFEKKLEAYATYDNAWISSEAYRHIEGQWVLKGDVVAPVVIKGIQAKLARKLIEDVLRRDPDADLLIME